MLGEWVPSPWVRLALLSSLVQFVYVVDASIRLWRAGSPESRRRALVLGGTLALALTVAAGAVLTGGDGRAADAIHLELSLPRGGPGDGL